MALALCVAGLGLVSEAVSAASPAAVKSGRARLPQALTKDRTAVSLGFLTRTGAVASDLRYSVIPGTLTAFAVVAYAYDAEGQQIVGPLDNPISLSFVGSALTLLAPASGLMTVSPAKIAVEYGGSASPFVWGLSEVRGGSTPVPFDMLQTGLNGYGNPSLNASICTATSLPQASGYARGTTYRADTRGCLTVAPLIVSAAGALGPNLSQNLDVTGQLGA